MTRRRAIDFAPPPPPASATAYERARARQFADLVFANGQFAHLRLLARAWLAPDEPRDLFRLLRVALRVADPLGAAAMIGRDDEGGVVVIRANDEDTQVVAALRRLAPPLVDALGYPTPTVRLIVWSVVALIWPADSAAELAEVLPAVADVWLDVDDGALARRPDPQRPRTQRDWLDAWEAQLVAAGEAEPAMMWTAAGRPRKTGYYSDRESFIAACRSMVPQSPSARRAFTRAKLARALGIDGTTLARYLSRFRVDLKIAIV